MFSEGKMFKRARVTPTGVAVGVIVTLVIGSGTAFAASSSGQLRLGKSNKAHKATKLTNTRGTPLSLKAGRGKAPLRVNSKKKVKRLNADLLDGLSSGSFARSTGKTGVIATFGNEQNSPGNAYAVAVAYCPSGTVLTGGGGFAQTTGDALWYSGPGARPNSWEADSDGDSVISSAKDIVAYAVCYNPKGGVPGSMTFPQLHALMATTRAGR